MLYLFVSIVFGKKLSEYMAFRDTSSLVSTIVALAILVLALASLTVFRLSSEISAMGDGQTKVSVLQIIAGFFSILASPKYVDPVSKVFVMTLIMSLSAIIGAIYAYYGSDAVSGRIYRISLSELPKDRALYNKIFLKNSNNIETERNYDLQEWKIDKQAVDSAFKLGSIASQLNGMVDPADAHDFLEAQKLIGSDYFNERG
ncbi:MAG: hypothetical protein Q4F54_02805 [Coriobacteriia bacterium]|nr:hypothetical protein [Coriobacteriia bacterium]